MSEHSDMDSVLRHWFEEGPSTMPDRVVDVVADRIARQRQRPAWRLLWRETDMHPIVKYGAAIAAVLVIAIVGWNLLPGRSNGVGVAQQTPTPAPSLKATTPTPAPARPWWVSPDDAGRPCGDGPDGNGCAGELNAGTHRSVGLVPPMQFTVPPGWINTQAWRQWYTLIPDTPATRENLEQRITLMPDFALMESSCSDVQPETSPTSADRMMAAVQAIDGVDTSQPRPITVGGLSGRWLDLKLSAGWTKTCPDDPANPTVPVLGERLTNGARFRYILLNAPGGRNVLIKLIAHDQTTFDTLTTTGMPIVESFDFDFGAGASASPS